MSYFATVLGIGSKISRGMILLDFWSKDDTRFNIQLSITYLLNLGRCFAETLAPLFISGGIEAVANRTPDSTEYNLKIFGKDAGNLKASDYMYVSVGLLASAKIIQNINFAMVSRIQMNFTNKEIGKKFIRKLYELKLDYLEENLPPSITSTKIQRATDHCGSILLKTVDQLVPLFFNLILATLILSFEQDTFEIITVTIFAIYVILMNTIIAYKQNQLQTATFNSANSLSEVIIEDLTHMESIRANLQTDTHQTYLDNKYDNFIRAYIKGDLNPSLFRLITITVPFTVLSLCVVNHYSSDSITKGELNSLLLIVNYMLIFLNAAEVFGKNIFDLLLVFDMLKEIKSCYANNQDIENNRKPELPTQINHIQFSLNIPIIEFVNVSYEKNHRKIINNVSFKIISNQTYALVGNSGSGKSTIIKLIMGFISPTAGEIKINGKNITTFSVEEIRSNITYIPQGTPIFRAIDYPESTLPYNVLFGDQRISKELLFELRTKPLIAKYLIKIECSPTNLILDIKGPSWICSDAEIFYVPFPTKQVVNRDRVSNDLRLISKIKEKFNLYCGNKTIALSLDEADFLSKMLVPNHEEKPNLHNPHGLFAYKSTQALIRHIKPDFTQVSGGEQQRISWARGWRENPIMILDEPTSALDSVNENNLINNFNKFLSESNKNGKDSQIKTVIISAHRLDTIKRCSGILLFNNGELVCKPSRHDELIDPNSGNALYQDFYNKQHITPSSFQII